MYICLECQCVFDSPITWREAHGEPIIGCPNCGGAFDTALDCKRCGMSKIPESRKYELHCLCDKCRAEVFEDFKSKLKKYSRFEIEYLDDRIDGYSIIDL